MKSIRAWPLRKPLAIYAALLAGICVLVYLWRGNDLPPNLTSFLQWFCGLVLGYYYSSSTAETILKKEGDKK